MNDQNTHYASGFPEKYDGYFVKKALSVLAGNFDYIVKLIIVSTLFITLIQKFFTESLVLEYLGAALDPATADPEKLIALIPLIYLKKVIELIPETLYVIVFIATLPAMYENTGIRFGDSLNINVFKLIKLYIYSILIAAAVYAGMMMCLIPGLLIMVHCTFIQFVVVLENSDKVISRSFSLISGMHGRILGVYILKIVTYLLLTILGFLGGFMGESQDLSQVGTNIFLVLFQNLLLVAVSIVMITMFFQLYMMARIQNNEIEAVPS